MKSGVIGGLLGSLIGILLGAAAFRTTSAVDSRFTYQGQIRNGEALVDGNIDVRFTLWDSLDSGATVGSAVTKTNLPVADGRFATELDFGSSAFAGDSRWIQMEVRSPAGSGQYLALAPRQMINAVPYALYSLNGGLSPWNLDVASRDIGYTNGRVGIGTNSPTAALEVVSATTGDDAVKLPAGSIGANELAFGLARASNQVSEANYGSGISPAAIIDCPSDGFCLVMAGGDINLGGVSLRVDGVEYPGTVGGNPCQYNGTQQSWHCFTSVPVTKGHHEVTFVWSGCYSVSCSVLFIPNGSPK
jgi:hypothetical protein